MNYNSYFFPALVKAKEGLTFFYDNSDGVNIKKITSI